MIGGKRVLAIIPARGGSKGLPGKNLRLALGKPLIQWTIEAALNARHVDHVILSSDDDAIITAASAAGCHVPFKRPAELATDQATTADVVLHALENMPAYDLLVLLQPTSPLRSSLDIDRAIETLIAKNAPACVSIAEVEQSPYWMYRLGTTGQLLPILNLAERPTRRQDLPPAYTLNGAIYIADCNWFIRTKTFLSTETTAYLMPQSKSIDIDTELDFMIFEKLASDDLFP